MEILWLQIQIDCKSQDIVHKSFNGFLGNNLHLFPMDFRSNDLHFHPLHKDPLKCVHKTFSFMCCISSQSSFIVYFILFVNPGKVLKVKWCKKTEQCHKISFILQSCEHTVESIAELNITFFQRWKRKSKLCLYFTISKLEGFCSSFYQRILNAQRLQILNNLWGTGLIFHIMFCAYEF